MEKELVRLECLKLANHLGRPEAEVLARAKNYEDYVLGQEAEPVEEVAPQKSQKKSGNLTK